MNFSPFKVFDYSGISKNMYKKKKKNNLSFSTQMLTKIRFDYNSQNSSC